MIQEIGDTKGKRKGLRIFRDEDDGHTIRVTVCGETSAVFPDLPGTNIEVEDLGYPVIYVTRGGR